jgi:hypothetical protein
MQISLRASALAVLFAGGLAAADAPYIGKWKVNPAKSDFGEMTVSYEQTPSGELKITADGQSYTVKPDGKEYPTPWGVTSSWKTVDANTWETTNRANGKVVSVERVKLAPDGKSLTVDGKTYKATGETSNNLMTFQRVSGTQGLSGKWKTKNVTMSAPGTVEIAAKGSEGIVMTYVDEKGVCDAKFDGKDYPATGPMWPSGWTCVMAKSGPQAFEATWKKDGKPMYRDTYTVSADGKTLTDVSGAPATTEKIKVVYEKQ